MLSVVVSEARAGPPETEQQGGHVHGLPCRGAALATAPLGLCVSVLPCEVLHAAVTTWSDIPGRPLRNRQGSGIEAE